MTTLPVDDIIPQILAALAGNPTVIIQAPPGSGKSTRVPVSLLESDWLGGNRVLMLEPRRLAALNLAVWMAAGFNEKVGGTVGYSIRFDRKVSKQTRLEIVTEGILTRRLLGDPFLESVGAVIFDEFHERSIHTDTALSLCLYLQRTLRPDLRILIMSATLEIETLRKLVPEANVVSCEGTLHPVDVRYLGMLDDDAARSAARAVTVALRESEGDVLVFLPGTAEIRRCLRMLQQNYPPGEPLLLPLYGDLNFAEQERAIRVSARRKVVLATNIAETSITIEGVRIVVDSGFARKARFDSSRGLDRLVTERISKASAAQRAGRSGRTAPGVCYRLWSEYQQTAMLAHDLPEILTADLAELALSLAVWGVDDVAELYFPDQPPAAALAGARRLLRNLGLLDDSNRITDKGGQIARIPLHPRLAALLLTAVQDGSGCLGADLAAIMAERDFLKFHSADASYNSDLLDRVETLVRWRANAADAGRKDDVDFALLRKVDLLSGLLRRILSVEYLAYEPSYDQASLLVAAAFPDRIARQRRAGSSSYLLASGKGAELLSRSWPGDQDFIVAVRLDAGQDEDARIYSALAVDLLLLRKRLSHLITVKRVAGWDQTLKRVTVRVEESLGAITMESRVDRASRDDIRRAVLDCLESGENGIFIQTAGTDRYRARVDFLRSAFPEEGWPDLAADQLLMLQDEWLPPILEAIDSPNAFKGIDLLEIYRHFVGWKKEREMEKLAPTTITVPSGSTVRIEYDSAGGPFIAVKLQEMFGLGDTPRIAGSRVPLLIHLLSPAGRPIQVTRDLRSFWNSGYQEVKKELKGRYPKHPWPDDPWSALPTRHVKKRLS